MPGQLYTRARKLIIVLAYPSSISKSPPTNLYIVYVDVLSKLIMNRECKEELELMGVLLHAMNAWGDYFILIL
jgi:hypothetical protein